MSKKSTLTIEKLSYLPSSVSLVERLNGLPGLVFLDSCQPQSASGRFDIISACPHTLITCDQLSTTIDCRGERRQSEQDPFLILKQLLKKEAIDLPHKHQDLPFIGGAMGYFSYDLGRRLERLPTKADADISLPLLWVGIYPWTIVQDHVKQQSWLVALPACSEDELNRIRQRLQEPAKVQSEFFLHQPFSSNISAFEYRHKFDKIANYIETGDCYQINLAQRFSSRFCGSPWQAYSKLRNTVPAPHAAYVDTGQSQILSFSPERFLHVTKNQVETKPIKGTRPRARDKLDDQAAIVALKESAKDRAENLMIVDLLRNDLGKNCRYGSINVEKLFAIESFANVHHLVSTIRGELAPGHDALDLLKGCFPGGSITGAPKVRAMEIIDELEPHRRSVYCGSIGYVSAHGNMDTNIAIRTLLCEGEQIHCWGGGGIVADSSAEAEYRESIDKVKHILSALEACSKGNNCANA